jgi:hypothetical protein
LWIDSEYGSGTSNILRWRDSSVTGQTTLSGTDDNGTSLVYVPGYEQVYINGVLQFRGSDYVATNGTSITGLTALVAGDVVEVIAPSATQFGDYYTQAQSDTKFNAGYRYLTTLYYTSTGTFAKASYPNIRAMVVKCQGAGGGSGGTGASNSTGFGASGGGAGGNYAEKFITDISGMASSVTVTVGAGGAGAAAGNNNGSAGGTSSFGSYASAAGGGGGFGHPTYNFWIPGTGGAIGGPNTGDFVVQGEEGGDSWPVNTNGGYSGKGGRSQLSPGIRAVVAWQGGGAATAGLIYGGGAAGSANGSSAAAKAGAAGASGIVIVELYA